MSPLRDALRSHAAANVLAIALAIGSALALSGCPREPVQPPPPEGSVPCERTEDCNGGATCGALSLCVDGYCESGRSLVVPCTGGEPIPIDAGTRP